MSARHRTPTRLRRRAKRELEVGPERMISYISPDRREETLVCGHVLHDAPTFIPLDRPPHPPKFRRCPQCKGQK